MEKAIPVLLLFLFVAGIASPGSDRYPWGNFCLVFEIPLLYYAYILNKLLGCTLIPGKDSPWGGKDRYAPVGC